jgi:hypothetical protein
MVFLEDEQSNFIFGFNLMIERTSSNYFNGTLQKESIRSIFMSDVFTNYFW